MPSAESALLKARAQLLMDHPFYGTLALRLKLVASTDCKTMATDGRRLIYNPDWVLTLDAMETRGVLAHEVLHVVLCHMTRRQGRDPNIWNAACDLAENPILIKEGFILPKGGLIDPAYEGMPAEEIYSKIKDDPPKPAAWGMVLDSGQGELEGTSPAALEAEWQVAVTEAAQIAKQAGKMPGYLEEFIQEIVSPIVDWRAMLWPFFTTLQKEEYTWTKPNRAYISEDEYLPSLRNEAIGEIACIIDVSGSTQDYFQPFISEMSAIHTLMKPSKLVLIGCDTEIRWHHEVEPDDEFPMDEMPFTSGGTCFSPAFNYIKDNHPDVEAVVYLTDLESNDFGEEPLFPVLWVSTTKLEAPWGETTHIQIEF